MSPYKSCKSLSSARIPPRSPRCMATKGSKISICIQQPIAFFKTIQFPLWLKYIFYTAFHFPSIYMGSKKPYFASQNGFSMVLDHLLKYISSTVVQRFSQVDPILLLVLSENLHISGRYFLITVLIFQYIDSNLPYLSYFEQKV